MTTFYKSIIASAPVGWDGIEFKYTGSFTGNLLGTSSNAITAAYAMGSVANFSTGNYTGNFTNQIVCF